MEEVQISSPLIWKEVVAERILIGKVISRKSYTRSAMIAILQKAWNMQEGFSVVEINGNSFMFSFTNEEECSRILRGRPWTINGCLLNLLERSKFKSCEEFDFSCCPVWVQIHNVPMEAMCLENAISIGGYIGEVLLVEDPHFNDRFLRSFLRARILLDLRKPLAYGFWMPRPEGKKVWLSVRYEKLQCFCYNCGKVGHDNRGCGSERLLSVASPSEPRFGAWITTTACRSWEEVMVIIKKDWIEADFVRKKKEEAVRKRRNEDKQQSYEKSSEVDEDLFAIKINKPCADKERLTWRKVREEQELNNSEAFEPDHVNPSGSVNAQKEYGVDDRWYEGKEKWSWSQGNSELRSRREVRDSTPVSGPCSTGLTVTSGDPSRAFKEHPLAMIPYSGGVMNNVINQLSGLGLKRSAKEEWESSALKRRKLVLDEPRKSPDIASYAANLRKAKAKLKRDVKRKKCGDKENIPAEVAEQDADMEVLETAAPEGSVFIFKAKGGRRRKCADKGSGGWPSSATQPS
ncbi:hypothetical protein K1719_004809 [Acacia pycnantha]|nr:hypothetical protein K1719_004809 [Acacia pycnantha]